MSTELEREMILELESADPEDLVRMFGLSSEQILRAFPGHAYDYVRSSTFVETGEDDEDIDIHEEIEKLWGSDDPPETP